MMFEVISQEEFTKSANGLGFKKNGQYFQKDGKDLKLTITYLEGEISTQIIQTLKNQFERNGIKLVEKKIPTTPDSTTTAQQESFTDIVNNRNFEAILTGIDLTPDPDIYNEWHSSKVDPPGLNLSGYSNKFTDQTLVNARLIDTQEERKKEYFKFQVRFFEETPAIYLINPGIKIFLSNRILNTKSNDVAESDYFYESMLSWEINPKYKFN